MKRTSNCSGYTLLEIMAATFIMTIIISGAMVMFGLLADRSEILFAGTELRDRVRLVETFLRQDLERAVPTAELEFYAELDGVPGPHFAPEPFADYGNDGIPSSGEVGFSSVAGPSFNPDPNCDDFNPPAGTLCPPLTGLETEGNGLLDQGEWLFDIDGNGRYTGESYWDTGGALQEQVDAPIPDPAPGANFPPPIPVFPFTLGGAYNFRWDFNPVLTFDPGTGGFYLQHETWPNLPNLPAGVAVPADVDGDRILSPHDAYMSDFLAFTGDPTPPEDNPLTLAVDETMRAVEGSSRFRYAAMEPNWGSGLLTQGQQALAWDYLTRNYQILSPFGFLDGDAAGFGNENPSALPTANDWIAVGPTQPLPIPAPPVLNPPPTYGWSSTNNRFDPGEIPLYDYFAGIVNNGDQDTLYVRTRVEIGGQLVPANVYYRLVFRNENRNYSELFVDGDGPAGGGAGVALDAQDMLDGIFGVGDGVWQIGEGFPPPNDLNRNGVPDTIVDPGERILQRIVTLPGNPNPIVTSLGPALRFNVEYFDETQNRFVAPFSDTGNDGVYSAQELGSFGVGGFGAACPDPSGDDFFPGLNPLGTEGNGILDLVNNSGIPTGNLNWNPFLATPSAGQQFINSPMFPSGVAVTGENPLVGIKKFGYPESAGMLVYKGATYFYPLDSREPLPVMSTLDWVTLSPVVLRAAASYSLLYSIFVWICDPNPTLANPCTSAFPPGGPCPADGVPRVRLRENTLVDNRIHRFSPGGVFDEEGWLRCSGVRDSFVFLRPGDEVFVWAFRIPPEAVSESPGTASVTVPVPPNYYPLLEVRGNRLRLDLSKVPGGSPPPNILRGTPAVFRAGYLPPAMRIDFALEGSPSGIYDRDLRVWSLLGTGWRIAGRWSQGIAPTIPIRGTVFTVAPGQGSGRGSPVTPEKMIR